MSKFDFKATFYSIKLAPESQKISVRSERQQFVFERVCFGLTEAPSLYCFLLSRVSQSLENEAVFAFLDDCALGSTQADIYRLSESFLCVRKGGIRISVEKSCLLVDSLELCGFTVSRGQLHLTAQRRNALLVLAYPT